MIHYHGAPITPVSAAIAVWRRRHAFVSFAHPEQLSIAAEVCQSFALDNGAYSSWRSTGSVVDVCGYARWVRDWERHPGFDWAVIPDVIDGSEQDNDDMIHQYAAAGGDITRDVPVWHLHESIDRLGGLAFQFRRVALGSSGEYASPNTAGWWRRMADALNAISDGDGRPYCKLHGLRMLDAAILRHVPLSSADSTNVARNIGIDQKWEGPYAPITKGERAIVIANRIEHAESAAVWTRAPTQAELFGSLFAGSTLDASHTV